MTPGVFQLTPQWELLLGQIGLPLRHPSPGTTLSPDQWPVLIIADPPLKPQQEQILEYLHSGGAALMEAHSAAALIGLGSRYRHVSYLCSRESRVFGHLPVGDLHRWCRVPAAARYLPDSRGKATVTERKIGKGRALILPSGMVAALAGHASRRLSFPPIGRGRPPSERVAAISRGFIRLAVQRGLQHLYHRRNLPFVKLWSLPGGRRSLLGLRIDTDFASRPQVEALYQLCRDYEIPATWFIETKSAAGWLRFFGQMIGQEAALHCYRHRSFSGYSRALADIQRGLQLLHDVEIQPQGYAAPYGQWHPQLGRAMIDSGFSYSSEFSLGYDCLPFAPLVKGVASPVLQVPIHPISVGRLRWARHSPSQMAEYYQQCLICRQFYGEPAFVYHHPGQGHNEVFKTLFEQINRKETAVMSMGDYAAWWRRRAGVSWKPVWDGQQISVDSSDSSGDFWVRVSPPAGGDYLRPLNSGKGAAQPLSSKGMHPADYPPKLLRRYTRQMLMHDINWYLARWKQ